MDYIELILLSILTIIGLIALFFLKRLIIEVKKVTKSNEQLLQLWKEQEHSLDEYKAMQKEELKGELQSYVYLQALAVRDAVYKQTNDIFLQAIEDAPKSHGLSAKELSTIFSREQIDYIHQFWQLFDQYLRKYWLTEQGSFKTVFRHNELDEIHHASKTLVKKLDQLLKLLKEKE